MIIQNYSRSQRFYWDSKMLISRFCQTVVKTHRFWPRPLFKLSVFDPPPHAFKHLQHWLSGFPDTHPFHKFQKNDFQNFEMYRNNNFRKWFGFSWNFKSIPGSPKINNIGFGAHGHVPKSRKHENEGVEGSHISKSKSYKLKTKQNNITELLSISFL